MSRFHTETIIEVHHWNDSLFTIKTTRDAGLRFINGQFVMIGLMVNERPLFRAYSIASANYDEYMEFFSIKVQDGPLTSRLQNVQVGDQLLVSKKPTGTLIVQDLKQPAKNLYLLATGTGLAPFLSLVKDPEVYENFEKVILVHGVRTVSDLAYHDYLNKLPNDEVLGELIDNKLIYYPTVTRETFRNQGRLTDLMVSGQLFEDIGLPRINPQHDRAMICGSPSMLKETSQILNNHGLVISPRIGVAGDYVIERAFVE